MVLAWVPSSVFLVTSSRSMSPVARWQTWYFALMAGAWVPLPGKAGRTGLSGRANTDGAKKGAGEAEKGRKRPRTGARGTDEDEPELLRRGEAREGGLDGILGRGQLLDGALLEGLDLGLQLEGGSEDQGNRAGRESQTNCWGERGLKEEDGWTWLTRDLRWSISEGMTGVMGRKREGG